MTPLRYLFLCSVLVVWRIPFFASSEYSFDQPTVIETTETGELVNLDESIIRLFNESIHSVGIMTGSTPPQDECTDCNTSWIMDNGIDKRGLFQRKGRCFGAFRPFLDGRLANRGFRNICNADGICCDASISIANAYFTYYSNFNLEWEQAVKDCVATCADPEDCLVLQGHSIAGPVVELAGFVLSKYKPLIFMTGSPPAFADGCPGLDATRLFHFDNSITYLPSNLLAVDSTTYLNDGQHRGHRIILSRETNAVSYWGFNQPLPRRAGRTELIPFRGEDVVVTSSVSHLLTLFVYSYQLHAERIIDQGVFPIPFGWDDGAPCSRNIDCKSGNCDGVVCVA